MASYAGVLSTHHRDYVIPGMSDTESIKRRSSSRNIKRPKFDDELVESSLGGGQGLSPLPKFRMRNTSMSVVEPPVPATPTPSVSLESRKRVLPKPQTTVSSSKKARKGKNSSNIPSKDLGRWKPTDDLALILGVQQTCDLTAVHRGVKFSCKFTLGEIQERWYALLYDPTVSKVAQQAMKNLHPEQISAIESKALFSKAEEEILSTIKSNSALELERFEALLQNYPDVFHVGRTAKSLLSHWQQLKQYYLLPDQNPSTSLKHGVDKDFYEAEKQIVDSELLQETIDPAISHEQLVASRANKRRLRHLEDKVAHLSVLVDSVTGISPPDFDTNTLATLKGRLVRYLMRSDNITLGRKAAGVNVDVDLTLEGPAWKISRRQGIISLLDNKEFILRNEGKRAMFVDGKPVVAGSSCRLLNNSVLEIAALRFIFLINAGLVNQRASIKTEDEGPETS
ncbi:Microspherule protein N-terminal domain [Trinorchestia longiramus]|nr:Microspherule protein N-terminal domain [Trinorchestia longiramus]